MRLCIGIPCYNEEEILEYTTEKLSQKMDQLIMNNLISDDSKIVFFDDGSNDNTWEIISKLHDENKYVNGIKMSRNRGHQNTLFGGLVTVKDNYDCCISIDADLQDDIEVIDNMIREYENGAEIVYGVRNKRDTDTLFKKGTALAYYKMLQFMGVDIVYNHADFRLMSKKALNALSEFNEVNLFLRGMIPLIGMKYSIIEYERKERLAGKSKYPLKKMIALALDGITSMSLKPIRIITTLGFLVFAISLMILIYCLVIRAIGRAVSGWTSTVISIWLLGGLQLLSIGVIGEYVGKTYMEAKSRPSFFIEETLGD